MYGPAVLLPRQRLKLARGEAVLAVVINLRCNKRLDAYLITLSAITRTPGGTALLKGEVRPMAQHREGWTNVTCSEL